MTGNNLHQPRTVPINQRYISRELTAVPCNLFLPSCNMLWNPVIYDNTKYNTKLIQIKEWQTGFIMKKNLFLEFIMQHKCSLNNSFALSRYFIYNNYRMSVYVSVCLFVLIVCPSVRCVPSYDEYAGSRTTTFGRKVHLYL